MKTSSMAKNQNKLMIIAFCFFISLVTLLSQVGQRTWMAMNRDNHKYIFDDLDTTPNEVYTARNFMGLFMVLLQLVPIDLAVCNLIAKLFFVGWTSMDTGFIDLERSLEEGVI